MTEPIRQVTVWSDDVCRVVDRGDDGGFRDLHPRYGGFFPTRTRDSRRWPRAICGNWRKRKTVTVAAVATVINDSYAQLFQHFISKPPWDHKPVLAQIGQDADRLLGGKFVKLPGHRRERLRQAGRSFGGRCAAAVGAAGQSRQLPGRGVRRADRRTPPYTGRHAALPAEGVDRRRGAMLVRQARDRGMRFEWVGALMPGILDLINHFKRRLGSMWTRAR